MQIVYFDASALVKRYSPEVGSALIDEVFRLRTRAQMRCLIAGVLEVVSILTRKRNDGRLTPGLFDKVVARFKAEAIDDDEFTIEPITDELAFLALDDIPDRNLNATDALVLRSALALRDSLPSGDSLSLWTSDKRLLRAATAEGLTVFDPEQDTLDRLHEILGEEPTPDRA